MKNIIFSCLATLISMICFGQSVWTNYNTKNRGIADNAIAVDAQGVKWMCTESGLLKFDGSQWTTYNTSNSGIPTNTSLMSIAIDAQGNQWVGSSNYGLIKFDGSNWTNYVIPYVVTGFNTYTVDCISLKKESWI